MNTPSSAQPSKETRILSIFENSARNDLQKMKAQQD